MGGVDADVGDLKGGGVGSRRGDVVMWEGVNGSRRPDPVGS